MRPIYVTLFFLLIFSTGALAQVVSGQYASAEIISEKSALKPGEQKSIVIQFTVKPGFHAQSHTPLEKNLIPTQVKSVGNDQIEIGQVEYPPGEIKDYPLLGKLSIYEGSVKINVPVTLKAGATNGSAPIKLNLIYQACNDLECYPPETLKLQYSPQPAAATTTTTAPATQVSELIAQSSDQFSFLNTKPANDSTEQLTVMQAFSLAFLAGLLFNIMPCVLPVLPLKVLGFYEASHHSRAKSFLLGVVFSIGVISTFAVLAFLIFGLNSQLRIQWGDFYSKGWFIWTISILIGALGLSMVVGKSVNLPTFVYRFNPRHDTVTGNYFWGILTTIFATPCTAPLFPPILLWAYTQPMAIGMSAMLMVGVGMASPYLILSALPEVARKLPRAGAASEVFKQTLGCMMIVSAGYFLAGHLIHGTSFWWAVFVMIAVASLFLVMQTITLVKTRRSAIIASVFATAMIALTLWWTVKITGVFNSVAPNNQVASTQRTSDGRWIIYSDQAFLKEVKSGPVLVKFTANWCATCQVIEGTVFSDDSVWSDLKSKNITAIKVDLTEDDAPGKNLLLKLNPAGGIPLTAIWFSPDQSPIVLDSVYSTNDLRKAIGAN